MFGQMRTLSPPWFPLRSVDWTSFIKSNDHEAPYIYIFLFWARALLVLNREWFCQVNLCLQICNNEIPKNGRFSDHATLSNFYYLEQSLVEMETVKRVWDENCQTPCAIGIKSLFCPQNMEKVLTVTKLERPNWSNCRWSNGWKMKID